MGLLLLHLFLSGFLAALVVISLVGVPGVFPYFPLAGASFCAVFMVPLCTAGATWPWVAWVSLLQAA